MKINKHKYLYILSISAFLLVTDQISWAQSLPVNPAYIVTLSGDTIRDCEIKKSHRKTNKNKVTYLHNEIVYRLPADAVQAYFTGSQYYVSDLLTNEKKQIFIRYFIRGAVYFGQSYSKNGKAVFYLKRSDTQELLCLANYKYDLLSFYQSFLPDFETFYTKYKIKPFYDYKSIAELVSAYNAFKEPDLFIPVKYKYRENFKFGIHASLGKGNLELIDGFSDFTNTDNFSFGLNFKHYYSRSSSFQFSLSYNSSGFIGTNEDVFIKTISIDPGVNFGKYIIPRLEISLKAGLNLGYNIDSYLSRKTGDRVVSDITGFNLGPQFGVDLTYSKRYSIFINYLSYKKNTNGSEGASNKERVQFRATTLQFGLIFYFMNIYSK